MDVLKRNDGTGKENPGWMECNYGVFVGFSTTGRSTKKREGRVQAHPKHPQLLLRPS